MTYGNPLPVIIVLVPVFERPEKGGYRIGLLLVKRTDGGYALPGGCIEVKHGGWRGSAVTEVREETGVAIDPAALFDFAVHSTPDATKLLVFCVSECVPLERVDLAGFQPNEEVEALDVWWSEESRELKFSTHQEVAEDYLWHHLS
jgi:ADP-ribose pyrophosphatase YjhB (NUDIX family)